MSVLTRTRASQAGPLSPARAAAVIKSAAKASRPSLPRRVGQGIKAHPVLAVFGTAVAAFVVTGLVRLSSAAGAKSEFRNKADENQPYPTTRAAAPNPHTEARSDVLAGNGEDDFDSGRDGTV